MLKKPLLSTKHGLILLPILASVVSFLAYLNTLNHQFVFDDFRIIENNPCIKDLRYLPSLFTRDYFQVSGELSYRPLVTLTYFIDCALWGLNPFGFHLTNVLAHTFNTPLMFFVVFALTGNTVLAGTSCLLFGAHPILVEAVNSIGFREDLLCATFFLLAVFFYGKFPASRHKKIWYSLALLSYFLSLLSKEMAITLPITIILADLFFPRPQISLKIKAFRYYPGFALISAGYLLLRFVLFRNVAEHVAYPGNSMVTNALTMTKVVASYIRLWFFPVVLNPDYHATFETTAARLTFLLSAALLASVVAVAYRLCRRQKEAAFAMLWTCATLLPVMNFLPLCNIMAERYLYLPSVGFCLLLGILILKLQRSAAPAFRMAGKVGFTATLVFFCVFTIKHNRVWQSQWVLWSHAVNTMSCSFTAHNNLGKEYYQKGMVDKAIEEYHIALSKAAEVQYKDPAAHFNLGLACDAKGRYGEAIQEYRNALRIEPKNGDAYNNLAITFIKTGQLDLAIQTFQEAITHNPNNAMYHQNLAMLYDKMNMPDKARAEQEMAERLRKN